YGRDRQWDLLGHDERREDYVSPTGEQGNKSMHPCIFLMHRLHSRFRMCRPKSMRCNQGGVYALPMTWGGPRSTGSSYQWHSSSSRWSFSTGVNRDCPGSAVTTDVVATS